MDEMRLQSFSEAWKKPQVPAQRSEIVRAVGKARVEATDEPAGDAADFEMAGELHETGQAGSCANFRDWDANRAAEKIENARDGTWDASRNRTNRD
jgi:hypothetical protein